MKANENPLKETSKQSNPGTSNNLLTSLLPRDVLEEIDINDS